MNSKLYDQFRANTCTGYTMLPKIALKKNGLKYIFNNIRAGRLGVVKVEDCLLKYGVGCDYMLLDCAADSVYLIEMNTSELELAILNILRCIEELKNEMKSAVSVHVRIILPAFNAPQFINTPQYYRLIRYLKKVNGTIKIEVQTLIEQN